MKIFGNRIMLALLAFSLLAWTAAAAATNISGTWKGSYTDPVGHSLPATFNFQENGGAVTGTVSGLGPHGATISNGKIVGNRISFDASGKDAYGKNFSLSFSGRVSGNQIQGVIQTAKVSMPFTVTKQ